MSNYRHGMRKTRLYNIWRSMNQRCNNPKTNRFLLYGGRGISVCEEWKNFVKFANWALENGYEENLTIDRIDCNGNYEPSNCRWSNYKVQANNKRNNKIITFCNESHTISEWSDITGIKQATIHARLKKGWNVFDAFNIKPIVGRNRH